MNLPIIAAGAAALYYINKKAIADAKSELEQKITNTQDYVDASLEEQKSKTLQNYVHCTGVQISFGAIGPKSGSSKNWDFLARATFHNSANAPVVVNNITARYYINGVACNCGTFARKVQLNIPANSDQTFTFCSVSDKPLIASQSDRASIANAILTTAGKKLLTSILPKNLPIYMESCRAVVAYEILPENGSQNIGVEEESVKGTARYNGTGKFSTSNKGGYIVENW